MASGFFPNNKRRRGGFLPPLNCLDQGMALAAGGELDQALAAEIGCCDHALLVAHRLIVNPRAVAADEAARFADARREPRLMKKANRCQTFLELRAWQFDHRQILADAPFGEDAACSLGCG